MHPPTVCVTQNQPQSLLSQPSFASSVHSCSPSFVRQILCMLQVDQTSPNVLQGPQQYILVSHWCHEKGVFVSKIHVLKCFKGVVNFSNVILFFHKVVVLARDIFSQEWSKLMQQGRRYRNMLEPIQRTKKVPHMGQAPKPPDCTISTMQLNSLFFRPSLPQAFLNREYTKIGLASLGARAWQVRLRSPNCRGQEDAADSICNWDSSVLTDITSSAVLS